MGLSAKRLSDGGAGGGRSFDEFDRGGGADLDGRDGAAAVGVGGDVVDAGPDLALGDAAAGAEEADDVVDLLVADAELAAELAPAKRRDERG